MSARKVEVVVIGGGVAGLAAASTLAEAGVSTLVVEARQRLGGLVHSSRDELGITERGAEFIHDTTHIIARILEKSGAVLKSVPPKVRYVRDGELLSDSEPWVLHVRRIKSEIGLHSGRAVSVAQLLCSLSEGYPADALERVANAISSHEGAPVDDLSMAALNYYGDTLSEHARICGGFGLLVDFLKAGVDALLGCPVTRVSHDGTGVRVFDQEGKQFISSLCAVIAVPLGVLQSGTIVVEPGLDSKHREALSSLRMNRTIKIALDFSSRIFGGEELLSLPGAVPEMWATPRGAGEKLTGFSGGRLLIDYEELFSDVGALTESLLETLEMIFGSAVRRSFSSAELIDWSQDLYARGSCSYSSFGASGSDLEARRALASPLSSRLFLCGEATNFLGAHGTVHGAYDTGIRAANEALEALRGS